MAKLLDFIVKHQQIETLASLLRAAGLEPVDARVTAKQILKSDKPIKPSK